MNLWLRSQQKEMLFKVNNSVMVKRASDNLYFIECDGAKIAMYKTYEKTLQVLEQIEILIETNWKNKEDIVYQMPKEEEYSER